MTNKVWIVAALAVAGCSQGGHSDAGKTTSTDKPEAPPAAASARVPVRSSSTASNTPQPPSSGAAAASKPIAALPGLTLDAVCSQSALLLVEVPLAQAGKRFCDLCGKANPKACSGSWPDDFVAPGKSSDERLQLMRNTIYAAHGYQFRKEQFKKLFGAESWYHPNPNFKPTDLSVVSKSNLAALTHGPASSKGIEVELEPGGSANVDLDGDGKAEAVSLSPDGKLLTAAGVSIQTHEHRPKDSDASSSAAGLAIIDLDRKRPGKELALFFLQGEDDHRWVVLELAAGKPVRVGEVPPGEVPGDGTVVATSWNCGVVTKTTFGKGKGDFVEKGRRSSGKFDASQCAG